MKQKKNACPHPSVQLAVQAMSDNGPQKPSDNPGQL